MKHPIKQGTMPDTQAMPAKDCEMAMSEDACAGMSGGAMGDMSQADVKRGYRKMADMDNMPMPPPDDSGSINDGFLGRPQGWER